MSDDFDLEFLFYELALSIAGPGFNDTVILRDEDTLNLQPTFIEVNGLSFERYPGKSDQEFVEVRFDYVVAREIKAIYKLPEPAKPTPSPTGEIREPEET